MKNGIAGLIKRVILAVTTWHMLKRQRRALRNITAVMMALHAASAGAASAMDVFAAGLWPFIQHMEVMRSIEGELGGFGFREVAA